MKTALAWMLSMWLLYGCAGEAGSSSTEDLEPEQDFEEQYGELGYVPVLGAPVVHDPHFFLTRLIYSIDFPIKHLVIYYNDADPAIKMQMKHIAANNRNLLAIPAQPPMGVADGWNTILRAFPAEKWFFICAYDIQFLPGALEIMVQRFVSEAMAFAFMWAENAHASGYNTMALASSLIDVAGYFDTNIFPAFHEDTEWSIRLKRLDPPCEPTVLREAKYIHGFRSDTEYISGVSRIGNEAKKAISHASQRNCAYVAEKWGCPVGVCYMWENCTYSHPFNNSAHPVSYWHLDTARRAELVNLYHTA
ncbi:hypothetical protein WJX72_006677 [[Myrmecia] bisecta]|uniref:Uncharacterized protein n=1 Tax=[Myrmecia] bisecta TaxID=41462 RepID=A0AAW1QQY5_9CHLO